MDESRAAFEKKLRTTKFRRDPEIGIPPCVLPPVVADQIMELWQACRAEQGSPTTLETMLAQYKAIEAAPEHRMHVVRHRRVDTWRSKTGAYVARLAEAITQGETEERAVKAAEAMILAHADWAINGLPAPPVPESTAKGSENG
jgi:predicted RNase H-like HicB family nuclease